MVTRTTQALQQTPATDTSNEAVIALQKRLEAKTLAHDVEVQSREKMKAQHDREEKLIVSAWYDMALVGEYAAGKALFKSDTEICFRRSSLG